MDLATSLGSSSPMAMPPLLQAVEPQSPDVGKCPSGDTSARSQISGHLRLGACQGWLKNLQWVNLDWTPVGPLLDESINHDLAISEPSFQIHLAHHAMT